MPSVVSLTKQLRCQLPSVQDVNGRIRPEFTELFDTICKYDPQVSKNYERFFEWVEYLLKTQKDPFSRVTKIKLSYPLIEAAAHFAHVVRGEIVKLLKSRKASLAYLSRLSDFIPARGRLEVFTLNYDCCVEDACAATKTYLTTGFDPVNKQWKAQLFHGKPRGINLYKLHGSLRWFGTTDTKKLARGLWTDSYFFLEVKAKYRRSLPKTFEVSEEPTLILGPPPKLQTDDPFLTLFHKFHHSLRQAKTCVVIGYGYGDDHVNEKVDEAIKLGVHVLNVNPADPPTRFLSCCRFHHVKMLARQALERGQISSELAKLGI